MFTDQPTTPGRLETLLAVLQRIRHPARETVFNLFQPPTVHAKQDQVKATVKAAEELCLIEVSSNDRLIPTGKSGRTPRQQVLDALDRHVLATTDVEPYFA